MVHISDEQIGVLAKKTVEKVPYSQAEREQMIHMKECRSCYEDFCVAIMLEGMSSTAGMELLSKYYKNKAPEKEGMVETIKDKLNDISSDVIVAIRVLRKNAESLAGAAIEQISQLNPILSFQPVLAGAMRGVDSSDTETIRFEDVNDSASFVLLDADENALMIQIDIKALNCEAIRVDLENSNGKKIPVDLKYRGGLAKGLIKDLPDGDFDVRITKL